MCNVHAELIDEFESNNNSLVVLTTLPGNVSPNY